ncbi:MAG TPA: penicillin-binding protein activator, partial [Gammaproteobacteria bacterium]|nr:penicillin-binding protein activator [Gammaproteobacteria bacterium]
LWLDRDEDILANHELIWEGLRAQPVLRPVVATGEQTVDGWLALLPIAIEARSNPYGLTEGLDAWLQQYPRHPAVQLLLPELRERDRLAQTYPAQIALLLPLRSYEQPAAAIRDGFIAAYLQNPSGAATRLRIYDTDELGAQQAYLQAQLDGADFVVGPLVKTAVEQVAVSSGFVPTLALNNVDNAAATLPPNFYQFGLAPEDEAAEIVRHAVTNGAKTAVALFPNSEWGLRVFDSFQRELAALGGRVLESRAYDSNTQDFALAITALLNLNDSTQRRERLTANLGVPIEFEPRRRQDVDMIFFAAEPRAARLLAPQFRFHFAGNLPIYATSDIYDTSTRSDPDLNGVIFADAPLLLAPDGAAAALQESLRSYWPQRTARWLKFYGFGFDAYRIVPMLYNGTTSFLTLQGMSGQLWVDGAGRVRRRLPVAQFVNGRPVRLTPAEPTDAAPPSSLLSQR